MASDSGEATRRKHHRYSNEDAGERSKRRKHRHHHHRHRSSKDKDEASELELEGDRTEEPASDVKISDNDVDADIGDKIGAMGLGTPKFTGLDYEMEEGEILDDNHLIGLDGEDSKNARKKLPSDVEPGEFGRNGYDVLNTGVGEENVEGIPKCIKTFLEDCLDNERNTEIDRERLSNTASLANGDYTHEYPQDGSTLLERHEKRTSNFAVRLKYSSPEKKHSPESCTDSHDMHVKESSNSNLSKSPEWPREMSRSRSILHEVSVEDDHLVRNLPTESDDDKMASNTQNCRQSRRDGLREKEWESKSGRYSRTERLHGREPVDVYRDDNKEMDSYADRSREKDMENEKDRVKETRIRGHDRDRGEMERVYVKDSTRDRGNERERDRAREKERSIERERGRKGEKEREREREREKERKREREREKERKRERGRGVRDGGRSRSRDMGRDNESRYKYDKENDGIRHKDNDSRSRRYSQDRYRDKSSKGDTECLRSKAKKELVNENFEIDDDKLEDYQEKIAMKLAEKEEDEVKKIKEESQRWMQAILEKYKNQQKQNESQPQLEDQAGESSVQEAPTEIVIPETGMSQTRMGVCAPDSSFSVGKSPWQNGYTPSQMNTGTGGLGEGSPKSEGLDDMFCDDIFGESPAGFRKAGKGDGATVDKDGLNDNWDDAEGYYGYRFGEVLDGRYEIVAAHGKGVFSTVVRAKDLKAKLGDTEEVAIKIIRNNETMFKAGMEELVILKKLVGADPENKRHCIRFLSTFKYRNHLCLVFESLHMNLRDVLKKFGRNIGLKLTAVRAYAKQLFIALKHLKNCCVLHCDIKPDNMLVNEAKNVLKLCDFGNAMFVGKNEITPYLVSRFYRSPEIILGLPYDHPLDVWSVGCCLFELYTGKVLFPGPTNNDMLRLHMELKGPFPKKMLRKGAFTDQHIDQDLNFVASEEDPITKKAIRRLIVNIKPKDFGSLISGSPGEDLKMIANFKDLLEKVFILDPEKRLSISQALSHPFITGK